MRTARLAPAAVLLLAAAGPATRPTTVPTFDAESVGRTVVLRGRTGRPLGQVMTLTGVALAGRGKVIPPELAVRRIDGVATQENLHVRVATTLAAGQTYRLRGYETGTFVGLPAAAQAGNPSGGGPHLDIQATGFHFDCYFQLGYYDRPEDVAPVTFTPADFVGRSALLAGTAANAAGVGWLVGPGWRLRSADDGSPWPDWMVGKPGEVDGVVHPGHGTDYRSDHAARRLVRLADQVGHPVELRGTARQDAATQQWWLDYRGDRVDAPGLATLPGWQPAFEDKPVVLRGTLTRPAAHGPAEDGDPYVLPNVTWSPLPTLRTGERSPADDN